MNRLAELLEGLAANAAYGLFRALPLDWASALGGRLFRALGPRLKVSRRAERNLRRAMPHLGDAEIAAIIRGMWDNLGRVAGEFPHLDRLDYGAGGRVEVTGLDHVLALRDDGRPGLLFGGHLGNWEIAAFAASAHGLPLHLIYRAANNPFVERLYRRARGKGGGEYLRKGAEGARRALELLRQGSHLALLVDQKMNDGIAVPFFGRDAMTAPALAQFALKFRCPVVPARVVRVRGARFRIEVLPPLDLPASGDRRADTLALMTRVNQIVEQWVREHPEQWLWLHRRWPD